MGKMSTLGVLRLRATSAVSRDKSVRRSAQDDVFVVSWRSKKQRLLGLVLPTKQVSAYGASPRLFRPMYAGANMGHPSREEGFVLCSNCGAMNCILVAGLSPLLSLWGRGRLALAGFAVLLYA
jgi:hypothetical protein